MKQLLKSAILIFIFFTFFQCRTNKVMFSEGVSQGITGQVLWFEGDLMPGIDKKPVQGIPVQREIHVYEATTVEQAEVKEGQFYDDIQTERIAVITSDPEGKFRVSLDPGTYSIFVLEEKGLFANQFDEKGYIHPVTIRENELVKVNIRIDYMAAY